MARLFRFLIVLMGIFGAISLLQAFGLSKGTSIMMTSILFVVLALMVERAIKKNGDQQSVS